MINWIRVLVGQLGDVTNKAPLFGSNIKKEGHVLAAKVMAALVNLIGI